MKAYCHRTYRPDFPEQFDWERLDSHKLREVACALARDVRTALTLLPEQRGDVPGIRHALGLIATVGDISDE